uniref:T-box domain-containing protein n=1 Tax=Stegastes partitus TaxID=144197 RepID=A0A3B4Z3A5_9TELE
MRSGCAACTLRVGAPWRGSALGLHLPLRVCARRDPARPRPGVSVTLENNSVWKQFYGCGTEMILTKPGRRMFPYCRYRLAGLDPDQQYSLVLSIVPSGQFRYRWSATKWEVHGPAEHQGQGLIRAFPHHYSPCRGSEWMNGLVSFYKLKLTNNAQDQDGHIILHSMHRYIPRLHVIPVLDGAKPTAEQPVVMGPESMTFTFPQTEFMAVTTYQNFRITQLKINHNPFAKGFREDGHNPRLQRVSAEAQPAVKTEPQAPVLKPAAEPSEDKQDAVDLRYDGFDFTFFLLLSSLDPSKPIDLQYLGVRLPPPPPPPPNPPEQNSAAAPSPGGESNRSLAFCACSILRPLNWAFVDTEMCHFQLSSAQHAACCG